MSTLTLALTHTKYSLLETMRVPIAVIGSVAFPAFALLLFVVPQRAVADNAEYATQAVISLSIFAVLSNSLFSFGLNISEAREKPWDPYLRTLPVTGMARVLGYIFSIGLVGIASLIPVVVIGGLLTEANAPLWRVLAGVLALAVASIPFMLIGISIGFSMSSKAAIAVVQVVMFGFAFAGGLFLPPMLFAPWLNTLSTFFPSRQARELVIWVVQGGELAPWVWLGILGWTVVMLVLALFLFRRDEGRRFH